MLVSLIVIYMLDGTGDPLVHLTTPIYTNAVTGKLKKGNWKKLNRKKESNSKCLISVANLLLSTLRMSNWSNSLSGLIKYQKVICMAIINTFLCFVCFCFYVVKPLLWDTSNSRVTFIQGTQNLVPGKSSHNLCICCLYWRDTSIQGKETNCQGPQAWI